jgi:hypothetical protein
VPKQLLEITTFTQGISSSSSNTDVGTEAPVYSENLETKLQYGKLKGIKESRIFSDNGFVNLLQDNVAFDINCTSNADFAVDDTVILGQAANTQLDGATTGTIFDINQTVVDSIDEAHYIAIDGIDPGWEDNFNGYIQYIDTSYNVQRIDIISFEEITAGTPTALVFKLDNETIRKTGITVANDANIYIGPQTFLIPGDSISFNLNNKEFLVQFSDSYTGDGVTSNQPSVTTLIASLDMRSNFTDDSNNKMDPSDIATAIYDAIYAFTNSDGENVPNQLDLTVSRNANIVTITLLNKSPATLSIGSNSVFGIEGISVDEVEYSDSIQIGKGKPLSIKNMKILQDKNDTSKSDLIYIDKKTNQIKRITNIYGSNTLIEVLDSDINFNKLTMETARNAIWIGCGSKENNIPKVIQHIKRNKFGNLIDSVVSSDARAFSPEDAASKYSLDHVFTFPIYGLGTSAVTAADSGNTWTNSVAKNSTPDYDFITSVALDNGSSDTLYTAINVSSNQLTGLEVGQVICQQI